MTIDELVARQLVEHARALAPLEACGLVLLDGTHVSRFLPLTNCASDPRHAFELDKVDAGLWVLLELRARQRVGLFHSHVDVAAFPSHADMRGARVGDVHVVYGVDVDELRAFVVAPNRSARYRGRLIPREEPLDVRALPYTSTGV